MVTTPKVLTDSVLGTIIVNSENKIYREIDTDQRCILCNIKCYCRK